MKKSIVLIATLFIVAYSYAQKKDSTAKKIVSTNPKPAPQQYFMLGTKDEFDLLYKVIADPDNVTRNQVNMMLGWIRNKAAIVSDTTQKKDDH